MGRRTLLCRSRERGFWPCESHREVRGVRFEGQFPIVFTVLYRVVWLISARFWQVDVRYRWVRFNIKTDDFIPKTTISY